MQWIGGERNRRQNRSGPANPVGSFALVAPFPALRSLQSSLQHHSLHARLPAHLLQLGVLCHHGYHWYLLLVCTNKTLDGTDGDHINTNTAL